MFKYTEMDRRGKSNPGLRGRRKQRFKYMEGYIEGQLKYTLNPLISKKWYVEKFRVGKTAYYEDKADLSLLYPEILWTK